MSVAPMMDRTDRHFRVFIRQITRRTLLYTEMITTGAILHGDRKSLLGFDPTEHPLALQLGGDQAEDLARCAELAEGMGFDEVNLNVGCPSARVQKGNFGVCLMGNPEKVAQAVSAMRRRTTIPITVKHRIGFDDFDRYEDMAGFVGVVAAAGCDRFSVHARKAWLTGLNPKENRTVPPLRYDDVHRLKSEYPELRIEINGGLLDLDDCRAHLSRNDGNGMGLDGAMIGRAAYENPYFLAAADRDFYGDEGPPPSRREVIERMLPYVQEWRDKDLHLSAITRHMLGLFARRPGARAWRRHLSENACKPGAGPEVLLTAMAGVPREVLDERA